MHVDAIAKQILTLGRGVLGGCLLVAALLGVAGAYPLDLASIQAGDESSVLRLTTQGKHGQLPHEVFCLEEPFRVVVDIFGADAPVPVEAHPGGMVVEVRSSVWKDDPDGRVVRYVIETNEPVSYRTQTTSGALEILLEVPDANASSPGQTAPSDYDLASNDSASHGKSTANPSPTMQGAGSSGAASTNAGSSAAASEDTQSSVSDPIALEPLDSSTHAADLTGSHSVSTNSPIEATPSGDPTSGSQSAAPLSDVDWNSSHSGPAQSDAQTSESQPNIALSTTGTSANGFHSESWPGSVNHDPSTAFTGPSQTSTNSSWTSGHDTAPNLGSADPRGSHAPDDEPSANLGRSMNLDVQNADVRTVFRSIAEFSGANIVADRDVTGPVSIRLADVPWRQALDIVCQSAGLIAVEGNGVIRVATLQTFAVEQIEQESNARKREEYLPVEVHVFAVGYAAADELLESVNPILSARGTANADSRTNSLIVTDIPTRIEEVATLLRSLDTKTLQVEITAELVDMDAVAVRRLGIDWDAQNLGDSGEGVSLSGGVSEPLSDASGQIRFGLIRSWGDLQVQLDALEQSNDATIISNPKITTINNSPAAILVGKEIPLITLDVSGNPITQLKKVGITLRVTPFINADNRITMDLHPEISDLSAQATVQGGLIFTKSEADTRVMVQNGQTAVIGGLIRTNQTQFEQGVPILRSIPILGHLFKTTDTREEKRELVIFVTPRIVSDMASK